ncbi:E3 ubiquitin-protein ligase ZSWIM2 [Tachysurus vachellii]|uniref:E3 ubiquitin-protein ligase ZSWIM2 n=1 Tax=Tachysurus vachellii TaxID=175792 RepID=UPI00296B0A5F|nr:E3 ubiquitin-protein ligase ZSWIM2 [Tachysurus vachellii]
MFRKTVWRKSASEAVNWHQDESLNTTILILREFGPTGFLLKEDTEPKNYKVFLGDPHTCTCGTFQKEKDLCKHICWVLMRKFRLPRDHEYCFQLGLVERQIMEVLQHPYRVAITPSAPAQLQSSKEDDGTIKQKSIRDDDICPICQEEMLRKRLPVAHCRFGCGNNVHISCMKVWADYQKGSETDGMVKCPLCRENFSTMKMLLELVKNAGQFCTSSERERLEKHLGIPCNNCRVCPVVGKCFKCTVCSYYHLCEDCFKTSCHPQHSFAVRTKRNQSWQLMTESKKSLTDDQEMYPNTETGVISDVAPGYVLRIFPLTKVHPSSRLLEKGIQCRLCLESFHVGQQIKTLPCRHKFHFDCIKTWLQESICCPVDWHVIYNPLTWSGNDKKAICTAPHTLGAKIDLIHQQKTELFVPGISLQSKERSDVLKAAPKPPDSLEFIVKNTLCIDSPQGATGSQSSSLQRNLSLEQAPVLASKKRISVKTSRSSLSLSPVVKRLEGSMGTQQSLFTGFSNHDNKAQRKLNSVRGSSRPLGLKVDGVSVRAWSSSGNQSNLELRPTSLPISGKQERN